MQFNCIQYRNILWLFDFVAIFKKGILFSGWIFSRRSFSLTPKSEHSSINKLLEKKRKRCSFINASSNLKQTPIQHFFPVDFYKNFLLSSRLRGALLNQSFHKTSVDNKWSELLYKVVHSLHNI